MKIKKIPDGYLALVKYFEEWTQKRMWLFKLDEFGDIIWQKVYGDLDPDLHGEECRDLLITNEGDYLLKFRG